MIVIFYGTGAELIKLLGVIQRVPRSELLLINSSQQHAGLQKVHAQLGITPDINLSDGWKGNDIQSMAQMAGMMIKAHAYFLSHLGSIKKQIREHDAAHGTKSVVIVHGDTLTTVIGSYMGRWLGLPVAHVEAGLRTHDWKSPFPEEIDRRIAAKFARIHYPPNPEAEKNLRDEKVKGEVINTKYNTAKDAIEQSSSYLTSDFDSLNLPEKYCLVLLHRTELIENKEALEAILTVINEHASQNTPVVFTEHSTTSAKIQAYGLSGYLKKDGITVIKKQPYFNFMEIVRRSDYIVTDGGGLQEDAYFLGIPTIVHRKVTERPDGLGFNAELSYFKPENVAAFLVNHKDKSELSRQIEQVSPSEIVTNHLLAQNYYKK